MHRAWLNPLLVLLLGAMGPAAASAQQVCNPSVPESTPTSSFVVAGNGTATDTQSGLMWKRCAEGQNWDGATCAGTAATYTWQGALLRAKAVNDAGGYAGHVDWRVPNVKELDSLVEEKCYSPSINATVFPSTPASNFWSASAYAGSSSYAWLVGFYDGYAGYYSKSDDYRVRLVRAGHSFAAPVLQGVASRKSHGAAGAFDLPLSLAANNPTTEPRTGPTATVVFTFDKALASGTASIAAGTGTAGVPTFSGNQMNVPLAGVTNAQYVTVTVSNVAAVDGGAGGSGSARIGFLAGDANQNRAVTLADMLGVNAVLTQIVTGANYLRDVNVGGTLSLADMLLVNTMLTQTLPAP